MTYEEALAYMKRHPDKVLTGRNPTRTQTWEFRWSVAQNFLQYNRDHGVFIECGLIAPTLRTFEWSDPTQKAGENPKEAHGATKPNLALVPPVASLHMAMALESGAEKYGAYNWRDSKVSVMTYIAAIKRHIDNFQDGEESTSDTGVANLGAVMASCAIILDAMSLGMAVDDRPKPGKSSETQEELKAKKVARATDEAGFGYGDDRR